MDVAQNSNLEFDLLKQKELIKNLELEKQQLQEKLKKNEAIVNTFFENISDFAFIENSQLKITKVSNSIITNTQTENCFWEEKHIKEVFPYSKDDFFYKQKEIISQKDIFHELSETMKVYEKTYPLQGCMHAVPTNNNSQTNILAIAKLKQLKEDHKEAQNIQLNSILKREIHHRIKNNLNSVKSILSLQRSSLDNKELEKAFIDAESRIMAYAHVHDILYRSSEEDILINLYLQDLSAKIIKSTSLKDVSFNFQSHIDDNKSVKNSDKIFFFGLILNELIINSIKHANNLTEISLTLEDSNGFIKAIYTDNGKPKSIQNNEDNFGTFLIKTFASNMGAEIEYSLKNGIYFETTFNLF